MVQAGQFRLFSLMAGVTLRLLVMAVYVTQALQCCQSLLPSLAGSSSFFWCSYTAAFPSVGRGIHLWGGGVRSMGSFIH